MTSAFLKNNRWFLVTLLALSLAGAALLIYSTPHGGLNVDVDSTEYYAAAHSLNAGTGWQLFSGAPFTFWPPLYPTALLIAGKIGEPFGLPPVEAARWLHALIFAGIILCAGLLLMRVVESRLLGLLGAVAGLGALPIVQAVVTVWSEPLFILLSLSAFLLLQRYADRPSWQPLAGAIVLTALACLQRYMGVTVVATGLVSILVFTRADVPRRVRDAIIYGALSLLPLGLWLVHNAALTGNPAGNRPPSAIDLSTSLSLTSTTLANWLLPPAAPVMLLIVALTCIGVVVAALRGSQWARLAALPASFVILYQIALLAFHAGIDLNPIGNRDLVPIYPALIVVLLALLDRAAASLKRPAALYVAAAFVGVWLIGYALPLTAHEVSGFRDWCCELDSWTPLDVVAQATRSDLRGTVLTNSTLLLYTAPFDGARFVSLNADLAQFDALAASGDTVVWFDDRVRKLCSPKWDYCHHTDYGLDGLRSRLQVVDEWSDGGVYKVAR